MNSLTAFIVENGVAISVVGQFLTAIFVLYLSTKFAPKSVEASVEDLKIRITKVEMKMENIPTKEDLHQLENNMSELRDELKRVDENLEGLENLFGRIPVDGSTISNVTRASTTVTVTLNHPTGITDFMPSTSIEGFKFYGDGTEIAVITAVRTNATTITLTLASTPTGIEDLKYLYGVGFDLNPDNLVVGNDVNTEVVPEIRTVC